MHRRIMPIYAAALVALVLMPVHGIAPAAAPPTAGLHLQDRTFLLYAMELDLMQAELGRLAADKARDGQVRRFARRATDHHRQSSERLARLARRYGIEPLQATGPLAQRMQAELRRLAGPRFDEEYIAGQVIYTYSAYYAYEREGRHGRNPQLRREADRQAEEIEEHRRLAQRIARRLGTHAAGLHAEDRTFLLQAMDVDLTQLRLSGLAADKARDARVQEFARRMLDYHRRSYDRLTQIAREHGIEPLQEVGPIARRMQDGLRRLAGPTFDWEYINAQAIYHYSAFYRYEREAIHGRDRRLRDLAGQASRDVKEHHDAALDIVRNWKWDQA